jgi:hypothetical protein
MCGLRQSLVGILELVLLSVMLTVGCCSQSDMEQQSDFAKPSATTTAGASSPKTASWSNCPERP